MAQEQRIEETSKAQAVESAGVESLIGRLRDQGIAQGQSQAEALVTAAQQQAADIVAAAKREAETIVVKAKDEAGKLKAAGEDAIRLAMRDTLLSLESDDHQRISEQAGPPGQGNARGPGISPAPDPGGCRQGGSSTSGRTGAAAIACRDRFA